MAFEPGQHFDHERAERERQAPPVFVPRAPAEIVEEAIQKAKRPASQVKQ